MNKPSYTQNRAIAAIIVCAGLLTACGSAAPLKAELTAPVAPITVQTVPAPDLFYTVERGDQLASIAESLTGDINNWSAIADFNGINNPRKLRIGQQLIVPGFLFPSAVAMQSFERESVPVDTIHTDQTIVGPTMVKVVVTKADPNKHFVLTPLGEDADSVQTELSGNDHIKVMGSYFPKVVYRSPQLDAKLLMRVAPGTTFPLEMLDDGWYRISTDQGVGFLRTIDGEPTRTKG